MESGWRLAQYLCNDFLSLSWLYIICKSCDCLQQRTLVYLHCRWVFTEAYHMRHKDTKIIRAIYTTNNGTTCKPSDVDVGVKTNLRQPFTMCLWVVWLLRYGCDTFFRETRQPLGVMSSWRVRSLWKITRQLCVW